MSGIEGAIPAVSVVIPVYNGAATIAATLASVLAQSFCDFEIIAVDDGSSDSSLDLLRTYAARDPRITVVARANGGVSSARNAGVDCARAPLIAFLDGDDLWHRDKLAKHVALHRAVPTLAASFARIAFIAVDAEGLEGAATLSSLTTARPALLDVLGENPVCTASNFVVTREAFVRCGGFERDLAHAEDQDIVARLIEQGDVIEGIDAVLVGYRLSPAGLSLDLPAMHAGWRRMVARHVADRGQRARLEAVYHRYLARRALRSGRHRLTALGHVGAGLREDSRAFLCPWRRGLATVAGALVAPFLPAALRWRLFA